MTESHLYPGFRFAGALPSIHLQRNVQSAIVSEINPRRILVLGCAYGDELATLIPAQLYRHLMEVVAIDLAPVREHIMAQEFVKALGSKFHWLQRDVMQVANLHGYGRFDLVQCGFLLHDIPHELKNEAINLVARAVIPGGYVLVSDILLVDASDQTSAVCDIYDAFLSEADAAYRVGKLTVSEWALLVGDGVQPGLLRAKNDALDGKRDFFDTRDRFIHRSTAAGLRICRIEVNRLLRQLYVILMRRPSQGSSCLTRLGECDVL